jgi:folate-dependent tRNA-U54 methylase TrmFO/GidA
VADMKNTLFTVSAQTLQQETLKGEIARIENDQLVIQTNSDELVQVPIAGTFAVKRNLFSASKEQLRPGDSVTLQRDESGTVYTIDATASGFWITLVTLAIGSLLLLIAISTLFKKQRERHIKVKPALE